MPRVIGREEALRTVKGNSRAGRIAICVAQSAVRRLESRITHHAFGYPIADSLGRLIHGGSGMDRRAAACAWVQRR